MMNRKSRQAKRGLKRKEWFIYFGCGNINKGRVLSTAFSKAFCLSQETDYKPPPMTLRKVHTFCIDNVFHLKPYITTGLMWINQK